MTVEKVGCGWIPRAPEDMTPCPNEATGGIEVTLKPAPAVQKRWGVHSMLTFVVDAPICATCFPRVGIFDLTDQKLRSTMNTFCQRRNNGFLVDWSQTQLKHVGLNDPLYNAMRQAKAAPKEDACSTS